MELYKIDDEQKNILVYDFWQNDKSEIEQLKEEELSKIDIDERIVQQRIMNSEEELKDYVKDHTESIITESSPSGKKFELYEKIGIEHAMINYETRPYYKGYEKSRHLTGKFLSEHKRYQEKKATYILTAVFRTAAKLWDQSIQLTKPAYLLEILEQNKLVKKSSTLLSSDEDLKMVLNYYSIEPTAELNINTLRELSKTELFCSRDGNSHSKGSVYLTNGIEYAKKMNPVTEKILTLKNYNKKI